MPTLIRPMVMRHAHGCAGGGMDIAPWSTGTAHGIHFRVVQMKYRAFLDTVSLKHSFSYIA